MAILRLLQSELMIPIQYSADYCKFASPLLSHFYLIVFLIITRQAFCLFYTLSLTKGYIIYSEHISEYNTTRKELE